MKLSQLLAQALVGALALQLHLTQTQLVARQRLGQRVEQLGDGLLALGEVSLGRGADLTEPGGRQRQELFVVLRQGLRRQLGKGSGQLVALLLGPACGLVLGGTQQLQFRDGDPRAVSAAATRSDAVFDSGRNGSQRRARGHGPLGQACSAGRAGRARHVPGNADGETGGEPDDHSKDHEANVTTGCVNNGDHPLPLLAATRVPRFWGSSPRNGADSVAGMPFKLGGSTKTIPEQVDAEDHPMEIGPAGHGAAALAPHVARAPRGRPTVRAGLRVGRSRK